MNFTSVFKYDPNQPRDAKGRWVDSRQDSHTTSTPNLRDYTNTRGFTLGGSRRRERDQVDALAREYGAADAVQLRDLRPHLMEQVLAQHNRDERVRALRADRRRKKRTVYL